MLGVYVFSTNNSIFAPKSKLLSHTSYVLDYHYMKLSLIAIITAWYAAIALWLKVMIPLHIPSNDSSAKWRIE